MVLRTPHEAAELIHRPNRQISLDLDRLAAVIRDANRPVAIQELAREAVRAMIVADGPLRTYVPGRTYEQGERVRLLDGRLGDIVSQELGGNPTQGTFDIISVRLRDGEIVRLASNVTGAPQAASPHLVADETVDMLLLGQEHEIVRHVRQALATDPRFITLYYSDGEYGCLREFFPPMSPDVLDAALAVLLDELFDQIPLARITEEPSSPTEVGRGTRVPVESLFPAGRLDRVLAADSGAEDPARAAFENVRSLWLRAESHAEAWDETQLARAFLQPMLRALGWSGMPLPGPRATGGDLDVGGPAYALCPDEFSASEMYIRYGEGGGLDPWALALAEVVAWDQPLDQPGIGMEDASSGAQVAPSHRLVGGLRETQLRWGILTNGRIWRLVSQDANSLARAYYEVDLGETFAGLAAGEVPDRERWNAFRRWWLLFRKTSYVRGGDGSCLLEHLRDAQIRTERHTRSVLRERLLTRALPAVAGGFVAYRRQRLGMGAEQPASLREIHRASVLFLTRVLFVLIAEARGLLPISNPEYRPHSLTTQAEWATERVRRDLPLSSAVYTTARYDVILASLHRIAKGDAEKGLPTYGRLLLDPTDHADHRFIERTRLSDQAVALALDAVFRGIDYAALDARDLIGACAGLVGTQLSVIDAEAGEVLITRRGDERVRSDTYPDFVVTSAVEQALGPVLSARSADFADAMSEVVAARRRLRRTLDRRRRSVLHHEWEVASRKARDAFLDIKVCDPAMGAGDFLLSAVDVLTDGIIAEMRDYHREHPGIPRDWNPIYRLLDEVSSDIREESARHGVTVEPQSVSDTHVLSRLVAQRTVFGVADDPLAVEVAKTGLWLHTFAEGAPLSFLEYHLRPGNALLGAQLSEVVDTYGLGPVTDAVLEDVETLYALTDRVDTSPLDVRWSAAQFARVQEGLQPYKRLLDLSVSAGLGWAEAAVALKGLGTDTWRHRLPKSEHVDAQAKAERFFHWVLEFPEVFVDLAQPAWREVPGFDLVLGAPPWTVTAQDARTAFYEMRFRRPDEPYNGHHAYLSLARTLVRKRGGRTAYVLSREWLASPTGGI